MAEPSADPSWFERNQFLLRRLHSLSGLVPIGLYMIIHVTANATIFFGAGTFQTLVVDRIHDLGPLLPFVEWAFIFLPLLFHAIFGFYIIAEGLPNVGDYPYQSNVRYTLQRATGIIAFAAIFFHVAQMHHMFEPLAGLGFAQFDPHHAGSSAATAIQSSVIVIILYVIGLLACVYHLANGLWTMGITWGVWTSPGGQRRAGVVCLVFGLGLSAAGLTAIGSMATLNIEKARIEEQEILDRKTPYGSIPDATSALDFGPKGNGAYRTGIQPGDRMMPIEDEDLYIFEQVTNGTVLGNGDKVTVTIEHSPVDDPPAAKPE